MIRQVGLALGAAVLALTLGVSGCGGGGGNGIERHFDQRGDAAGGCGAGGGLESFPLGAARLIDVDVGIHQPGHDDAVAVVFDRGAGRNIVVRADARDDAAGHMHAGLGEALLRDHALAAKDEVSRQGGVNLSPDAA